MGGGMWVGKEEEEGGGGKEGANRRQVHPPAAHTLRAPSAVAVTEKAVNVGDAAPSLRKNVTLSSP